MEVSVLEAVRYDGSRVHHLAFALQACDVASRAIDPVPRSYVGC